MRRLAVALTCLAAACGDDRKDAPAPVPDVDRPKPSAPVEGGRWDRVRPGDHARWEVRVDGSSAVTSLVWRATGVSGGTVTYVAESTTLAADGRTLAQTRHEERVPTNAPTPRGAVASEAPETLTVGGRPIATTRRTYRAPTGEVTVWTSDEVPFGGVVRVKGPGHEQALIEYGRGG
jgi:hypothetical protein